MRECFSSAAATAAGGGAVAQGMSGGHQLFSTMLSILGQGVFISLSCSPAHADAIGAQASVKGLLANAAWNEYINKLCETSLSEWEALFGEGRPTRASKPGPLKLEITLDDLPRFLEGRGLQAATRLATRSVRSLGGCPWRRRRVFRRLCCDLRFRVLRRLRFVFLFTDAAAHHPVHNRGFPPRKKHMGSLQVTAHCGWRDAWLLAALSLLKNEGDHLR